MGQIKNILYKGKFKKNLAQQPTEKNSALKKVLGEDFNFPQPKKNPAQPIEQKNHGT